MGFCTLCCDVFGLWRTSFFRNNNNKGNRSNVNKHESSSNAREARCLFIICVIVYNLYNCCYVKCTETQFSLVYLISFLFIFCCGSLLVFIIKMFFLSFLIHLWGLRLGHLKPPREIFGMRGGGRSLEIWKYSSPPPLFSSLLSV